MSLGYQQHQDATLQHRCNCVSAQEQLMFPPGTDSVGQAGQQKHSLGD
jgi:hypothetical protein